VAGDSVERPSRQGDLGRRRARSRPGRNDAAVGRGGVRRPVRGWVPLPGRARLAPGHAAPAWGGAQRAWPLPCHFLHLQGSIHGVGRARAHLLPPPADRVARSGKEPGAVSSCPSQGNTKECRARLHPAFMWAPHTAVVGKESLDRVAENHEQPPPCAEAHPQLETARRLPHPPRSHARLIYERPLRLPPSRGERATSLRRRQDGRGCKKGEIWLRSG